MCLCDDRKGARAGQGPTTIRVKNARPGMEKNVPPHASWLNSVSSTASCPKPREGIQWKKKSMREREGEKRQRERQREVSGYEDRESRK